MDDVRTGGGKQFAANFERADRGRHVPGQGQRLLGRGHIQRDNDGIAHESTI